MGQVYVSCTGVDRPVAGYGFRGLGVFPNASIVYYRPQPNTVPARVSLTIGHGARSITMTNCLVDTGTSTRKHREGFIEAIKLLDRRWAWEYRPISGRYNRRLPDGTIDPASQKTPQELATLLFQALGETSFDISLLPNDGYPEVDWQYSLSNLELHQLCKDRGCDVSLNTDDTVGIVRLGQGVQAGPSADVQWFSQTIDPPQPPDELIGLCGPTIVESMFRLKAIALDTDGQFKAFDDLSYKPAGGFEIETDIEHFSFLEDDPVAQACARKTMYRTYQIDSFADGTNLILGYTGTVDAISQVLPIGQTTLDTYTDETGALVAAPAEIIGQFVVNADPTPDTNSENGTVYDGDFRIDSKTGIVTFSRRVFRYNDTFEILPAKLFLRTTFRLENADGQTVRDVVTYNLSAGGGANKYPVQIPEINRRHKVVWQTTDDAPVPESFETNEADVNSQATAILAGVATRFTFSAGGKVTYRDIQNLSTSGVIRQIQWSATSAGAHTVASNNFEAIPFISPSPKRRQRATYKALDLRRINRAIGIGERNGSLQ